MGPTCGVQTAGPRQPRAVQPEYVGCIQLVPESKEKYTPETPTPPVNGQVAGLPAAQASSSISSFAPAASTVGACGSTATAGSFCLFCENGEGGLPTVTSGSCVTEAPAVADRKPGAARATAMAAPATTVVLTLRIESLLDLRVRGVPRRALLRVVPPSTRQVARAVHPLKQPDFGEGYSRSVSHRRNAIMRLRRASRVAGQLPSRVARRCVQPRRRRCRGPVRNGGL